MKRMMIVAGLMMVSTIIFAQKEKKDHSERFGKRADKMKTELGLNDEQYNKIKAINQDFASQQMKIRRDTALTRGTAQKKMTALRTSNEGKIKGVLTDAQWTKWTALKAAKKEDASRHRKGHHRGRKF